MQRGGRHGAETPVPGPQVGALPQPEAEEAAYVGRAPVHSAGTPAQAQTAQTAGEAPKCDLRQEEVLVSFSFAIGVSTFIFSFVIPPLERGELRLDHD